MDFCVNDALKLDYLNGLLAEKERSLFEQHLAACPECRREVVALRKTAEAIASLTPPSVPAAWTAAAKDRLRIKGTASARPRTNVFLYALITVGVIAGLVLLFWLALGGTVQRWLPGLSTASLRISDLRAARAVNLIARILSLHALLFVPSIIDNIYRLVRRGKSFPSRP